MTAKLSKYQTWTPWINEYNRLTTTGTSHKRAAPGKPPQPQQEP